MTEREKFYYGKGYADTMIDAMKEENACQMFDTGQFNKISRAYLILAMYNLQVPEYQAQELLAEVGGLMDVMPAEEALKLIRGGK